MQKILNSVRLLLKRACYVYDHIEDDDVAAAFGRRVARFVHSLRVDLRESVDDGRFEQFFSNALAQRIGAQLNNDAAIAMAVDCYSGILKTLDRRADIFKTLTRSRQSSADQSN